MPDRSGSFNPRLIYVVVFVVILIGLALPGTLWGGPIDDHARRAYQAVLDVRERGLVYVGLDYDSKRWPELEAQALTVFRHALSRRLRVVVVGPRLTVESFAGRLERLPGGPPEGYGDEYALVAHGLDLAAGNPASAVRGLWGAAAGKDYRGRPFEELPLLARFDGPARVDLAAVFVYDGTSTPDPDYVGKYLAVFESMGRPVMAGVVGHAGATAYLERLAGVLIGYRGAGDYERLAGVTGAGSRGAMSLNIGLGLILVLIVVTFLVGWRRRLAERLETIRRRRMQGRQPREGNSPPS